MLSALKTILPIFLVIGLGYGARRKGWLTEAFMASGNKLLYMVAIPCLLFHKISTAPFQGSFFPRLIMGCIMAIVAMSVGVLLGGSFLFSSKQRFATFLQGCIHGNIGYIGLAVCYYSFNERYFGIAGVLAGFFIITQNILSVTFFHLLVKQGDIRRGGALGQLVINPIILATLAGLAASFFHLVPPVVVERGMMIVGRMALPTALLIIGGSLDMEQVFIDLKASLLVSALKMIALPLLGCLIFFLLSVPWDLWVVGITLLSAPAATTCYIMSRELNGDPQLASSLVTTSILLSLLTFVFWLSVFKG